MHALALSRPNRIYLLPGNGEGAEEGVRLPSQFLAAGTTVSIAAPHAYGPEHAGGSVNRGLDHIEGVEYEGELYVGGEGPATRQQQGGKELVGPVSGAGQELAETGVDGDQDVLKEGLDCGGVVGCRDVSGEEGCGQGREQEEEFVDGRRVGVGNWGGSGESGGIGRSRHGGDGSDGGMKVGE